MERVNNKKTKKQKKQKKQKQLNEQPNKICLD